MPRPLRAKTALTNLLRNGVGLEVPEIAERFRTWNESELESFLIEISARVLAKSAPQLCHSRDRIPSGSERLSSG